MKLYKSIVLPHLDYCPPVWDPYHTSHTERLEKVQSFTARVIYSNWSRNASVSAMKSSLQLQSLLVSRQLCNKLSICHRILNGASTIISCSFFTNAPRRCASHKNSMTCIALIIIITDFTTNGTKTSIVSEVKNVKCLWLRVKL